MLKYDLGGICDHDGYISVNLSTNSTIKCDILDLDKFCDDSTVDEFLMSHTYEHLSPVKIKEFIHKILRKLKPNGILKIIHTDNKKNIELYNKGIIDFRALREITFGAVQRRIKMYEQVKQDLMGHTYMWGEEELIEELIFYGFSKAEKFNAGYWLFDLDNYFPKDNMQKFKNIKIENLGIIATK